MILGNSCISHWVWGVSDRKREVDCVNGGVMKEHWSLVTADEEPVHGTKLKVMRTKVSLLTVVEWEYQVWGGAKTSPAITTLPPALPILAEPISGARPTLSSTPSIKLSQKHKDWLDKLLGQLIPVSFHLCAPPFSDGQIGHENLLQLPEDKGLTKMARWSFALCLSLCVRLLFKVPPFHSSVILVFCVALELNLFQKSCVCIFFPSIYCHISAFIYDCVRMVACVVYYMYRRIKIDLTVLRAPLPLYTFGKCCHYWFPEKSDNQQGEIILICDHYSQVPSKLCLGTGPWKYIKYMLRNENWHAQSELIAAIWRCF